MVNDPNRPDCCGHPMYRDMHGTFSDGSAWVRYRCSWCGRRWRWVEVPRKGKFLHNPAKRT